MIGKELIKHKIDSCTDLKSTWPGQNIQQINVIWMTSERKIDCEGKTTQQMFENK
jgi:hypothetical protein